MKNSFCIGKVLLLLLVSFGASARIKNTKKATLLREARSEKIDPQQFLAAIADEAWYKQGLATFDAQMGRYIYNQERRWHLQLTDLFRYEIFRNLYAINFPRLTSPESRIPKKIHQIWIGSAPPPELLRLSETIKRCHPDWEYKLWRDADLAEFNLASYPPYFAAPNWGEKADILRYCILNKYGGVYLDMDIICLKSIEPLLHGVDFVIGIANTSTIECNNAVIAAVPHNQVIKALIAELTFPKEVQWKKLDTITRTGPQYVTNVICDLAQKGVMEGVLVLPISYFYPVPNTYHGPQSDSILSRYITDDSYCIHLWECRWITSSGKR